MNAIKRSFAVVASMMCSTVVQAAFGEPPNNAVADHLARLDHLVVEITHDMHITLVGASALDRDQWHWFDNVPNRTYHHRLTIVRPNVLDEWTDDDPAAGYEPVISSVVDGRFVQKHVRPSSSSHAEYSGKTHYFLSDRVQSGVFKWAPLLEAFDIHFQDSRIGQLNIARLFQTYSPTCVSSASGTSRYTCDVSMTGCTHHYDFDVADDGTPLRIRTTIEPAEHGVQPMVWEQFAVGFSEVNGARMPAEIITSVYNPNVAPDYITIHDIVVTSATVIPGLTVDDVRIELASMNAIIAVDAQDGSQRRRVLDAEGRVIVSDDLPYDPHPMVDADARWISRKSLNWRICCPVLALTLGFVAFAISTRRSRRP